MKKNELERIERLEYNEKVKDIILMIFAMIIFILMGIVIIVN